MDKYFNSFEYQTYKDSEPLIGFIVDHFITKNILRLESDDGDGIMNINKLIIFYCSMIIKQDGNYFCKGGLGRFLDEIAQRYKEVIVCAPVSEDYVANIQMYGIKAKNITFQALPPYASFIGALKHRQRMISFLKKYSANWNSPLYIRWPMPLAYTVYKLGKKRNLPILLHIVGDSKAIIRESGKYKGILKLLAITYINIVEKQVKRMINEIPTLVNGSGLRRLYAGNAKAKVKEIRSATLTADEITKEYKELNKDDVRLLYVGELKPEKGVNYLIEGFKLLIDQGYKVRLTIVGDGPEKAKLERKVMEMQVENVISFTGYVPLGPQLLKIYKHNDIFILPSISEGTPRVLIEAMANRLLVIATNVGGIPFTINNNQNGILIESKSPDQICCAVKEILKNDVKREQIIEGAFEFAKENTLESFVDNICNGFEL